MAVVSFSVLAARYLTPFWKASLVEIDPCIVTYMIWCKTGSHVRFHLLAPTVGLLAQSEGKLWPKSANESLTAKGIGQSTSDHKSSSVSSAIGWSHGVEDGIEARGRGLT